MGETEVPFFTPWITKEDRKAVLEALESRWLTGGPRAIEFENMFADYVGVKYAISSNSCTAALHLAMRALNIGPGDEVIVPVLTFTATASAPLFCGAKPIFADIDEKTFNISPQDILNKITEKTKAIIVVHYAGQPCDMKEIMEIAEDTIGCFSFYPNKIITTLEGGMATTNDKDIAEKVRLLKDHGMTKVGLDREKEATWYYDVVDLGYNYRLNEVQAALGISQFRRIEDINERRIRAAHYYTQRLNETNGITPPYEARNRTHVYSLYVIKVTEERFGMNRDELFRKLSKKGIGLSVHYTPLHLLTFYHETLHHRVGEFPVAERVYKEVLSLPLFPTLTNRLIGHVIKEIKSVKGS